MSRERRNWVAMRKPLRHSFLEPCRPEPKTLRLKDWQKNKWLGHPSGILPQDCGWKPQLRSVPSRPNPFDSLMPMARVNRNIRTNPIRFPGGALEMDFSLGKTARLFSVDQTLSGLVWPSK